MPSPPVFALIAQLRATVGDHPFATFLALAILWRAAFVLMHQAPRSLPLPERERLAAAAGLCGIGIFVGIAMWYALAARSYYDFAEPTVACIAWLFERGQPIYHAIDAAERYSHIYGPLAFILPGWFLAIAGPGIVASKLAGVLAGIASVIVTFVALRVASVRVTTSRALAGAGLFALLCLTFRNSSFWIRPDSFALLFASLTMLCSVLASRERGGRGWLAAIGLGVSAGALVNLKFTGLLYALPALAVLGARVGGGALLGAMVTTLIVAAAPFVVYGNVSLDHYVAWIRESAGNGLLWSSLRHNLEWALFLAVPLIGSGDRGGGSGRRGDRAFDRDRNRERGAAFVALLVGSAGVVIAASKPGAGPYHLLPFLPAVLYLAITSATPLRPTFIATTIIIATLQQVYFIGVMRTADDAGADAASDVAQFVDAKPERSIAMGYATAGERWTYVRPAIVFRTDRYPLDAPAVQEFEMSGLTMPDATIAALRRCDVEIWLIPKGSTPFTGPNKYPSMRMAPLFPEPFTRAFAEAYEHLPARDTRFFDVWQCRRTALLR
jgi:hypothetical protein